MRCPTMSELPPPPPGKTGWPWTEESPQLPDKMPDGSAWPRISIVTPSLNQGQFIEETIRSVLLQGYPDLEYIIIDGGSTDGSVDIIKKYEPWLTYWVSEPDKGQAHAINKGFSKASGDVNAYINSDDVYEPGVFYVVAPLFTFPENQLLVAGECDVFNEIGTKYIFKPHWPKETRDLMTTCPFGQPASFWSCEIHKMIGGMDETFRCCFDLEFFLRIALIGIVPRIIQRKLARFREHSQSKTMRQLIEFRKETISIVEQYSTTLNLTEIEKMKIIRRIQDDISYFNIFWTWKQKGRYNALIHYLRLISHSPYLLLKRKILGQGRRLIFNQEKKVAELERF